mgnify:CR=1 FL=1
MATKRVTHTFRKGDILEVKEYHDGRYGARGLPREKKRKPTPEQIAESESAKATAERAAAMLSGAPYTIDGTDYQISFTADDGNGVTQVKTAFELGLPDTTIYFSNGTKMPITSVEFGAFAAWFAQKRNEFFV